MNTKVKICGIRTIEAARVASYAGADFIGLNFVTTSKRRIEIETAKEIVREIDKRLVIVGVFQDAHPQEVNDIAEMVNVDFVQLHGQEDNEYIRQIKRPVIKSFSLQEKPEAIKAEYVMLDRAKQGEGNIVDLDIAAIFAKSYPLFLAGGLTPDNIREVVERVNPFAVDVAGGIETNGQPDLEKIRLFIERVKA